MRRMRERVHANRTVYVLAAVIGSLALVGASASLSGQALPWRSAQDLPAFEAVSIRPNPNADPPLFRSRFQPGSYQATYATARDLIRVAYGLALPEQVRGGPDWFEKERFEIQATAPGATTARMRLMLQQLLIERFKMSGRSEKAELPAFALMLARDDRRLGAGLKPLGETCPEAAPSSAGAQFGVDLLPCGQVMFAERYMARGISMARLAELMTGSAQMGVDRLVIDRTGLGGLYTIDFRFTPREVMGLRKPDTQDTVAEFPTAIREQLGLRLEPTRAPVDTIVVERIERPTPN